MAFTLDTWKESIKKNLKGVSGLIKKSGSGSVYAFVASAAILPVMQAIGQHDYTALVEMTKLTSSLGTSLLASKIGDWVKSANVEYDIAHDIKDNKDLRDEFDVILQELEAFKIAMTQVDEANRKWFKDTLKNELSRYGNAHKFTTIEGDGIVAHGNNAKAIGPGSLVIDSANIAGDMNVFTGNGQAGNNLQYLRQAYLDNLFAECNTLSLAGVDPNAAVDDEEVRLKLDAIYVPLITLTPEMDDNRDKKESFQKSLRCFSAIDQLNKHKKLALLGEPGGGKSAFVSFAALCFAGELLNNSAANLDMLQSPLPDEERDDDGNNKKIQEWSHGRLVPARVILRDFAATGLPSVGVKATAKHLWDFIVAGLIGSSLDKFAEHLHAELMEKGGVILLDGLDEVPEADNRRKQIKEAVEDFAKVFCKCRIVVTCRVYAYRNQGWRLAGFAEAELAQFKKWQIERFITNWYKHYAKSRGSNVDDAMGRARLLENAVFNSDRLICLAERPLLLTLMASLHAWRGGSLPEKREELYDDAVNLLLHLWEKPKTALNSEGKAIVLQPSIAEWLNVDKGDVRGLLNKLAFNAHKSQPELTGAADIPANDLIGGLMQISPDRDMKPGRLVEYLSQRAGLLLPRGVDMYSYPHRTFQEYLAACHLTEDDFPDKLAGLVVNEPDRWREVAFLAAAKVAKGSSAAVWLLVDALCSLEPDGMRKDLSEVWGAHIAAQIINQCIDVKKAGDKNRKKINALSKCLSIIAGSDMLPANERAITGRNIAGLGELRSEVVTTDHMQFCLVAPSPFWIGEKGGEQLVECLNYNYWLSRFPVTQAQFNEFVASGGYKSAKYWIEAKKAGVWKSGKIKGVFEDEWRDCQRVYSAPFCLENHPVVGITWYEAFAFARWLNEKWKSEKLLSGRLNVNLPSEAEWEKAARGGVDIMEKMETYNINEVADRSHVILKPNNNAKRIYPWGDQPDTNRANYSKTGIGAASAVGCFPLGASPYGCEEMAGNVWEWTRSIYKGYPYDPNDGREKPPESQDAEPVVRGGSFLLDTGCLRCACRSRRVAAGLNHDVGFRVALSPSSLSSEASEL